jgi:hypothetical protein
MLKTNISGRREYVNILYTYNGEVHTPVNADAFPSEVKLCQSAELAAAGKWVGINTGKTPLLTTEYTDT